MTKLYKYFQKTGGEEQWTPTQAETEFHEIKPTFITVLALDTLLEERPSKEILDAVKYSGPMYFDLDAVEIADSIQGGKDLLEKLNEAGLKDVDLEIYLSGKKGLHFLISPICFMQKPMAMVKLPAIYKEVAFKLAVDTTDFRVYTGRKGRMLRTCYNVRENGNYRVPITPDELRDLTPESYNEFCAAPRSVPAAQPRFRPEFALIFDAAHQKISNLKRKKSKPVTPQELRKIMPEVQQIMRGENLAAVGFNQIAIQLAVYAREAGWTIENLLTYAKQLIDTHQSDGRYNTPAKRTDQLCRMFDYIEDNPAYEYGATYIRSCLAREVIGEPTIGPDGLPEEEESILTSGVFTRAGRYIVPKGEDGDMEISNFVFRDCNLLVDADDGKIAAIRTVVGKDVNITLAPSNFTSSTSLQNVVSGYGKSFTGSDVHARGIYQIMLKEVSRTSYIVDTEGLNYIKLPAHPDPEVASRPFLAWADRYQVVTPAWIKERDVKLEFLGFPDERGVIQTDLTAAPSLKEYLSTEDNKVAMANCIRWLMKASHPETMAKLIGWMSAAHWKPLFQAHQGKFPLLHVYGPAGMGKCLGRDTPVIMFDGTIKMVQDIVPGDKLLGPDGTVRNVLNTTTGRESLYKVAQAAGDDYVVNESHILSLRNVVTLDVVNISILDYLSKGTKWQSEHMGWAVPDVLKGDFWFDLTAVYVTKLDIGDYYGFQIDGDHLFLLGDFTVTHNTELTQSLLRLFYFREDPKTTTPASTPFALLTLIGGSASIPVMLDEWKPAVMNRDIVEKYRAILRDAYNGKETQRGGGSRTKDSFNSLSKMSLDAPIVYISEACESETAILERSVILTFRRSGAKQQGSTLAYFRMFQANLLPLSVIGKAFATAALRDDAEQTYIDSFGRMLDWAYNHFMMQPGDDQLLKEGKITEDDMRRKISNSAPRPVYNSTVTLFGLVQLRNLLRDNLGELYDAELNSGFKELMNYAYAGLSVGSAMRPEYIKVLHTLSDMSKTTEKGSSEHMLTDGIDYQLSEYGGKPVLVLATRFAYNKYRNYMRLINQLPLYPNDTSFEAGIKEIPQYIKPGVGTKGLLTETAVLDLDALIAAGVPLFFGRTVAMNL